MRAVARGLLLALLALPLFGCSRVREVRECRALSAVIRETMAALERTTAPKSAESYRAASLLYASTSKKLREVVSARAIVPATEEYAAAVAALSPAYAAYAAALEANDKARSEAALNELKATSAREQAASQKLETVCRRGY